MSSVFPMYKTYRDALDSVMVPPVSGRTSPSRMLHQEESNYLPLSSQGMDSHQIPSNRIPSRSVPSQGMSPTTFSSSASPSTAMHDMNVNRQQLYASMYNPMMWNPQIRARVHQQMVCDWTFCPPFQSPFMQSAYRQHVWPLLKDEEAPPMFDNTGPSEVLDLSHHTEGNTNSAEDKIASADESTKEEMFDPLVDANDDEPTQEDMFVPRYASANEPNQEEKFVPPALADVNESIQEEKFVPLVDAGADDPTQEEKFVPPVIAGASCSQQSTSENSLKSKYKVG